MLNFKHTILYVIVNNHYVCMKTYSAIAEGSVHLGNTNIYLFHLHCTVDKFKQYNMAISTASFDHKFFWPTFEVC